MSTACRIGRLTPNGIQSIFVRENGDRSFMEPMLSTFYTDPVKVDLLFNRGPLLAVRKEPVFPVDMQERIQNVKSLVALDSIAFLYSISESFSDIGLLPEEDICYYSSIKEFIDEYNYFYDANSRTWLTGERDKNDFYNKDKVKIVKCRTKNIADAQRLVQSNKLLSFIKNNEYGSLKTTIEMFIPVTCHYSRKKENCRYYLTLGNDSLIPWGIKWDLDIPRKDTGKVIFRCNTLEEILKASLNVLWKL